MNSGTCQALTGGGAGYIGKSFIFRVFKSSPANVSLHLNSLEGALTDRNHTLAIIIQILHQGLTKTIHLPLPTPRMIPGQESTLLFQSAQKIRQFLHHALVRAEILLFGEDQAEIEYELIAIVPLRLHADRVAQDSVAVCAYLDQVAAEFLSRDDEKGDIGEGQEEWL